MKLIREATAQPELAQFDDPGSPCVGVCVTVAYRGQRYCCACGRSIEEIGEWSDATAARRAEIRQIAAHRLANLPIS